MADQKSKMIGDEMREEERLNQLEMRAKYPNNGTFNAGKHGDDETDAESERNGLAGNGEKKLSRVSGQHASGDHHIGVDHPTSYLETLIHLLKGNIGAAMFSMGDAFRNCGLILAPLLTLFLGVVCVHSQHLLLDASKAMKSRTGCATLPSFADTVQLAFDTGPPQFKKYTSFFKHSANLFLCITQIGFCCVYFVFIAENTKQVMDYYDLEINLHIHMAVILLPIMVSCWIRDLKYLVPVSLAANVLMFVGIIGTVYMISFDLPSPSERAYVAHYTRIPLYFGSAIYAFEGISLVLPLQSQMKKSKYFSTPVGVLNVGMSIVTVLLIGMGTLGYLKFGENVMGSLTLNLPQDQILSQAIKLSISLGVMFTYAIQMYVPIIIIWPMLLERYGPFTHPLVVETVFRSLLVVFTFVLAEVIPHLSLVISLVGAVSSTALALLLPTVVDIVTRWDTISTSAIVKNGLIFLIGIFGFLTGTYTSVYELSKAIYGEEPT